MLVPNSQTDERIIHEHAKNCTANEKMRMKEMSVHWKEGIRNDEQGIGNKNNRKIKARSRYIKNRR